MSVLWWFPSEGLRAYDPSALQASCTNPHPLNCTESVREPMVTWGVQSTQVCKKNAKSKVEQWVFLTYISFISKFQPENSIQPMEKLVQNSKDIQSILLYPKMQYWWLLVVLHKSKRWYRHSNSDIILQYYWRANYEKDVWASLFSRWRNHIICPKLGYCSNLQTFQIRLVF